MEATMWWDGYWHGPWMFGPLLMIVALVFCAVIMFFMMRGMMGGHQRSDDQYALHILKERFARGEISQAQYEEQRRVLQS
jgi:putative membrane protein